MALTKEEIAKSQKERIEILRGKFGEGEDAHPEVLAYDKARGKASKVEPGLAKAKGPATGDPTVGGVVPASGTPVERRPSEVRPDETGHKTAENPQGATDDVFGNGPTGNVNPNPQQ